MSFWSSLFGGANPTLNSDINQTGSIGGFATGLGEKNASQASSFFSNILSGDQSKIAKTLAPQISAIQTQGNQQKQTNAQFGNRSGGTNAQNQQIGDQSRSAINNMIAQLTGSAASNLESSGEGLLGTGLQATTAQAGLSQVQMQNWSNSILGKGVSQGIGAAVTGATGGLGTSVSQLGSGNFGW